MAIEIDPLPRPMHALDGESEPTARWDARQVGIGIGAEAEAEAEAAAAAAANAKGHASVNNNAAHVPKRSRKCSLA